MDKEIGKVTHYFEKVGVAVVELSDGLSIGDEIHIKGSTTDFVQEVENIQVDHKEIESSKAGDEIGLKVNERVRPNDRIYLK